MADRLEATLASQAWAQIHGARIIRTHDVLATRRVIDIISAIQNGSQGTSGLL
ncbi:MAG: hypothetical protein IT203_06285 [Fimbriimonadaceae bacterium]|nr:hypothetical protein [Fimbriimonadaceae bacterium]